MLSPVAAAIARMLNPRFAQRVHNVGALLAWQPRLAGRRWILPIRAAVVAAHHLPMLLLSPREKPSPAR